MVLLFIQQFRRAESDDYFIYFPPGYSEAEIDLQINIEPVWETKVKAMHCHQTQIKDIRNILKHQQSLPKVEHFLIKKRF
jgi:LmbE family N-acetylglucosaminyl deacetylase